MTRKMPQVREFMTATPHTVSAEAPLSEVQMMLREYRIRHLPVRKSAKVVGIISERSVKEVTGTPEADVLRASDLMISDPFSVKADAPLDEVAAAMAEEKFGSVLVDDENGNLLGIFTTVDACRALRQILETVYSE